MFDGETKKCYFEVSGWDEVLHTDEMHLEKELLKAKAVQTKYEFTSENEVEELKMEQIMVLGTTPIEYFKFEFGFIIPGSTNTFDSTIHGAGEGKMIPPEMLNGKLKCVIRFLDGEKLLAERIIKVFYE
eukprot:MONOS_4784.1-p1 / transcript=MONOS_4784.1 / gene=MONOS_4784 / organism=Monocercomonoides_exilis_PA203 / gene_product=unspecified product / transcript_product=unspecified product / location=Mono_scaffold00132:28374-29061(-) / protein_length=128 / sequence_SO=supercontig / SO=protein_coding / is_pseudo=false